MNPKGKYLATKMAKSKPMTKRDMLRKWRSLGSIQEINDAIDWIEANTGLSDNPFLFVWDRGEAVWGFRNTWGEVALNIKWNLRYLLTRMETTETVLSHALASPVVTMTPSERRVVKAISAQAGGTVAFLQQMVVALP